MHYLSNLNYVVQSDVYQLDHQYLFEWDKIVESMGKRY